MMSKERQQKIKKQIDRTAKVMRKKLRETMGVLTDVDYTQELYNIIMPDFSEYKKILISDDISKSELKEKKEAHIKSVTKKIQDLIGMSESDEMELFIEQDITTVYNELIKLITRAEGDSRITIGISNAVGETCKSIEANRYKILNADKLNENMEYVNTALIGIGESWIHNNLVTLLNHCLNLIIGSMKAIYYEPSCKDDENLEMICVETLRMYYTFIPALFLIYGLQEKFSKGFDYVLTDDDFKKIAKRVDDESKD